VYSLLLLLLLLLLLTNRAEVMAAAAAKLAQQEARRQRALKEAEHKLWLDNIGKQCAGFWSKLTSCCDPSKQYYQD
jgi:hypothetical protein